MDKAIVQSGRLVLGGRTVHRMGFGAMQLCGPGVFGPPGDRAEAIAVLREAVELGVDHIDTSDFYGPHIVNQIIREALYPYPEHLVLVSKLGARRDEQGNWLPARSPADLRSAVEDNLRHLGLERLDLVNLRLMFSPHGPAEGPFEHELEVLMAMQEEGKIDAIGISNATPDQVARAQAMTAIACVQNHYNIAHRADDALIDRLEGEGVAYVPYFPLGGFTPLQSAVLDEVAGEMGVSTFQLALAWLLQRSANMLLIPGTSSRAHLRENIAAASLEIPPELLARLNALAGS